MSFCRTTYLSMNCTVYWVNIPSKWNVFLSDYLPYLFIYLSYFHLDVCLLVCLSPCFSVYLFIFHPVCLAVCSSLPISVCLTVCLSTCLSINLSICLPVCLLTCLSVCSLVCPCLFTYFLLICLRVHPYLDVCLQYLLFIKIFSVHLFVCPFLLFVYLSCVSNIFLPMYMPIQGPLVSL